MNGGQTGRAERRRELRADPAMMRRAFGLLIEPGGVVEVRVIHRGGQIDGGFLDDFDQAVKAALAPANNPNVKGTYITMNCLHREVLARAHNRLIEKAPKGVLSKDHEVEWLRWLLIDCDIERAVKEISSSDEEKQAARETARAIRAFLAMRGWPVSAGCDSGNGYHLLYRLDLANTKEHVELLRRVLIALAERFDSDHVAIDRSVFNPSRIDKWYGTPVRKGDDTEDRPWRLSGIIVPNEDDPPLEPVSVEHLVALASEAAEEKQERKASQNGASAGTQLFDIDGFIGKHLADVAGDPQPYKGGLKWVLSECPFCENSGGPAFIIQFASGALSFGCLHSHCRHLAWRDLREKFEPQSARRGKRGRNGAGASRAVADEEDDEEGGVPRFSEETLALQFIERHQADLRFVGDLKRWLTWQGTRWAEDRKRKVFDLSRAVCRENAALISDDEKLARKVASAATRAAVVSLGSDDHRVTIVSEALDADAWLLGTPQGTVDLRSAELRAARREDYITRQTLVAPALFGAACPVWDGFLQSTFVMPVIGEDGEAAKNERGEILFVTDWETIEFVERWLGYCLTGDVREHRFIFGYGVGRNGKGTLFEYVMLELLGGYAQPIASEMLMERPYEPHKTEIASLIGARYVIGSEIGKGARWNEARLTQLTGGSNFRANFMRQDEFSFRPILKLNIIGNNRPRFSTINTAIRERLLLLPFHAEFTGDRRDSQLIEKLRPEYPAILRRLIQGCINWQRDGLKIPESVRTASSEYLAEHDALQEWIDECLIEQAESFDRGPLLTEAVISFNHWRFLREEKSITRSEFVRLLNAKNIRHKRQPAGVRLIDYQFTPEQAQLVRDIIAKRKEQGTGQQRMW